MIQLKFLTWIQLWHSPTTCNHCSNDGIFGEPDIALILSRNFTRITYCEKSLISFPWTKRKTLLHIRSRKNLINYFDWNFFSTRKSASYINVLDNNNNWEKFRKKKNQTLSISLYNGTNFFDKYSYENVFKEISYKLPSQNCFLRNNK